MTEAIFSRDSYAACFEAAVLACWEENGLYRVILDRTAFFPEQGGQYADTGTLGGAQVLDVQVKDGIITHFTDKPLGLHERVTGIIDWDKRYSRMQNHTGEHLISGIIHKKYGYDNVGFHLNDTELTLDVNGPLTREQLMEVEDEANDAVYRNLPVMISFPEPEQLASMDYRSKLELTENVRIVTVPGVDVCACCAPHVRTTGEIGIIKILDAIHYKGGMRVTVKCGSRALRDYRELYDMTSAAANTLHIRREELGEGVDRLLAQITALKNELHTAQRDLLSIRTASMPFTEGNLCFMESAADIATLRALVNAGTEKCSGICAAFSGSDGEGYLFVIGARNVPLRSRAKEITAALSGRGGGTDQMISGTVTAKEETIRAYIEAFQ